MTTLSQEICLTRTIHAQPEAVFAAFTSADGWCDWCAEKASADARVGGKLHVYTQGYNAYGEFTELAPNRTAIFTWNGDKEPPMRIQVWLDTVEESTVLTFKVTGLCPEPDWQAFAPELERIWGRVLNNLKNVLEEKSGKTH